MGATCQTIEKPVVSQEITASGVFSNCVNKAKERIEQSPLKQLLEELEKSNGHTSS